MAKKNDVRIGDVFLSSNTYGKHRFFVIGQDKNNKSNILVAMATSQCEKLQNNIKHNPLSSRDSIISIKPIEYQSNISDSDCSLTTITCFDCNNPTTMLWDRIKDASKCSPMTNSMLIKLQNAITQSPNIEPYIQEMIKN